LITSILERRFPASEGYGTLFPPAKSGGSTNNGLVNIYAQSFAVTLFNSAASMVPWEKLPPAFLKDRSEVGGNLP